jgi:UDP-N-acetylmuramoyl-tripeptide--D-alanyl-D-alanine ligase
VLAAVLAKRYRVWATKGNFNNLIGMPLTVLSAPADTEVLVLEMGMNHFHEIERLSQSANPNLAIVSKIGTSHIGILGSRENIARAKAEIVQGMCAAGFGRRGRLYAVHSRYVRPACWYRRDACRRLGR